MLNSGTHFRQASIALAHCLADLLEGRVLTCEEHSAAMRVLRLSAQIITMADPDAAFDWDRLREFVCRQADDSGVYAKIAETAERAEDQERVT